MLAKLWKQNIVLFVLLGVYGIASIYVYQQSGIFIHRAIVWNLFLALLPYTCMTLFFLFAQKQKHLGMGLSFLAWLLLFPNVPYLITDMIHISPLTFYIFQEEGSVYVRSLLPWLELLHLMSGILFGLAVGYRSFYCLHRYGERHWGKGISWVLPPL